MTECWSEGALRAYLDRELPTLDMQRVAAHLGECKVCDGLCTELAARAAHVSALMELLPEWSATKPRPPIAAKPRPHWVGIAVTLAAGLAVAAYLLADRAPRQAIVIPTPVPAPAPAPVPLAIAVAEVDPAPSEPPAPRRVRRARRPAPEPAYFVALDDEPFESGVIMRVDVKPGNVQADIVFGPDGRAHAFRLVNAAQRNF
jgi:hypothetical protein